MEPIARTKSGPVRGATVGRTQVFLGVPYAAAPVGDHRLGAPVAPAGWDDPRDAIAYGATAPQADQGVTLIPEPVVAGDDCLNVNVFTPDLGDQRLPVLVWIHGGGFVAGSSASPWYRGERFADRGVVTVSMNYRLGAEGFAAIDGAPTNRGLRDCIAALDWVQDNIAAFGGDPARVTVAGQSAGAAACCGLLTSPGARGRFRRVIAMSGTAALFISPERAHRIAGRLADQLGVAPTRAAIGAIDQEALVVAQGAVPNGDAATGGSGDLLPFVPMIDGDVVPVAPIDAMRAGVGGDIDLLVGSTSQEFNFVTRAVGGDFPVERLVGRLEKLGVDRSRADEYLAGMAGMAGIDVAAQAGTDALFRVNVARTAEARLDASAPTYTYEFRWPSPVGQLGAAHCLDIPFAFDQLDAEGVGPVLGDDPPRALADEMHRAWADFVTDGDPGWPRYEAPTRSTMVFDTPSTVRDDVLGELRAAWAVG
jgi:para-nitrobenzyl esterase